MIRQWQTVHIRQTWHMLFSWAVMCGVGDKRLGPGSDNSTER